ncbi:helix-turn-helix domain-containing protein [Mesonia aestuariivivens]|uniref:Helix-turn-helix domain-containing protein n=1 Tax=Mesonia aestuariivivens TaxID=2796128 RepID=A0ABS6W535_9FLAO|nr:helix-turn-helix domain-containing protein [Mesonia aestuariivivens]MBW2962919.1 helix-turn-helix domain-containing protein [Mesonia aestuariivivens]
MNPHTLHTDRLKALRTMILELAKGNFAYRLPINTTTAQPKDVEILLNVLAEELADFFVYASSFNERNIPEPFIFVLDTKHHICGLNERFRKLLGYLEHELLHQPLSKVMTASSLEQLKEKLQNIASQELNASHPILLCFSTQHQTLLDCWGYCHWVSDGKKSYFIFRGSVIEKRKDPPQPPIKLPPNRTYATLQLQADLQNLKRVHQFILENLHTQLPSLHLIARQFHMNEFKLKTGFKELYQTTIFKFHLNKRLEMAMVMIKFTPTSIKVIATSYGFKSAAHFSRVFKNKYGKSPRYFKPK